MGAFDKDKEIGNNLVGAVEQREHFILWACKVEPNSVQTDLGMADKTIMVVSKQEDANNLFTVTSISSGISNKMKELDPIKELPAMVFWTKVTSKKWGNLATVIQYVRDYHEGRDTNLVSQAREMVQKETMPI